MSPSQTKTVPTDRVTSRNDWHGTPLMPTFHPAFLLRNPNMKRPCWEDLQKVMQALKGDL